MTLLGIILGAALLVLWLAISAFIYLSSSGWDRDPFMAAMQSAMILMVLGVFLLVGHGLAGGFKKTEPAASPAVAAEAP